MRSMIVKYIEKKNKREEENKKINKFNSRYYKINENYAKTKTNIIKIFLFTSRGRRESSRR